VLVIVSHHIIPSTLLLILAPSPPFLQHASPHFHIIRYLITDIAGVAIFRGDHAHTAPSNSKKRCHGSLARARLTSSGVLSKGIGHPCRPRVGRCLPLPLFSRAFLGVTGCLFQSSSASDRVDDSTAGSALRLDVQSENGIVQIEQTTLRHRSVEICASCSSSALKR
jgi:hypothetical protein